MKHLDKYKEVFSLLLKNTPNDEIIINYYNSDCFLLQDFCVYNLKYDINWSTGIGIIEAVKLIVDEAISNGNIK